MQIHDTNMYTNILTKYRARNSFTLTWAHHVKHPYYSGLWHQSLPLILQLYIPPSRGQGIYVKGDPKEEYLSWK